MKRNWIVWGLTGLCAVVLSAWTVLNDGVMKLSEQEANIRIRKMGHELLLRTGDSTSRVLPVKKLSEGTYRLEFSSPFQLVPASLVQIAKESLGSEQYQSYSITVHDCDDDATVYGFLHSLRNEMNVEACVGRTYPKGCYAIQVALRPDEENTTRWGSFTWIALAFGGVCFLAFVMFRKKDEVIVDGLQLGGFRFVAEHRLLISRQGTIDLTDKETRILQILLKNRNELVKRELLMREVWNDHGVLESRSLDVFISRLRKKISGDETIEIVNTHGVGYTLITGKK